MDITKKDIDQAKEIAAELRKKMPPFHVIFIEFMGAAMRSGYVPAFILTAVDFMATNIKESTDAELVELLGDIHPDPAYWREQAALAEELVNEVNAKIEAVRESGKCPGCGEIHDDGDVPVHH